MLKPRQTQDLGIAATSDLLKVKKRRPLRSFFTTVRIRMHLVTIRGFERRIVTFSRSRARHGAPTIAIAALPVQNCYGIDTFAAEGAAGADPAWAVRAPAAGARRLMSNGLGRRESWRSP